VPPEPSAQLSPCKPLQKKEKKRKRDKKDKKKKKHKEKDPERGGKVGAVDQAQFGKWGIVRESDFFKKQREFEAWMVEVKKVVDSSQMQKWELRDLFKEYAEDFNTATLPHAKFINYEKWEVEEYQSKFQLLPCRCAFADAHANVCLLYLGCRESA
jgi:hypothetical protein